VGRVTTDTGEQPCTAVPAGKFVVNLGGGANSGWSAVGRRLKAVKDIRGEIAKLAWEQRWAWCGVDEEVEDETAQKRLHVLAQVSGRFKAAGGCAPEVFSCERKDELRLPKVAVVDRETRK
jgi:hypothetical protein